MGGRRVERRWLSKSTVNTPPLGGPPTKSEIKMLLNQLHLTTPILLMTATRSLSIVRASAALFSFNITSQHWPRVQEMANGKQTFEATYSSLGICYVKRLLPQYFTVEAHGVDNKVLPSKLMFYANTALSIKGLSEMLESLILPM